MSDNGTIQFIYASSATFGDGDIETSLTQRTVFNIVRQSRRNNPGWGVVGALLFGDGHFLQILEGNEDDIDRLTSVIFNDERHSEPKILRRRSIDAPQFGQWSMKFPTMSEDLRPVLKLSRGKRFHPHSLDDRKLDTLIQHLLTQEETIV